MFPALVRTYSSVLGLDSKIPYRPARLVLNLFLTNLRIYIDIDIYRICHVQSDVTCTKKFLFLTGSSLYLLVRRVVLS